MATYTITRRDLPNVWSHTFTPNREEGSKVTLYRSVPGDTSPWFTMNDQRSVKVVAPERFGPYGTRKEFEQWCSNFIHKREVARAA